MCIGFEHNANLHDEYVSSDGREAILFLESINGRHWLSGITSKIENYLLSRLPGEAGPSNSLEAERWRLLPYYEGDRFYDRKYSIDGTESEPKGTVTSPELREVGRRMEELGFSHDLQCLQDAYRQARNFDDDLDSLVEKCARES